MNANYHPYHYTPIVDLPFGSPTSQFHLYRCNFSANSQLLHENIPVFFTSVFKGAKYLEKYKTLQNEFHSQPVNLSELPQQVFIDPCPACGFYEILKSEDISLKVTEIHIRTERLIKLAVSLFNQKNYDDSYLVFKNILNHLDPAEADCHFFIGKIGLATGDQLLIQEAESSLANISPTLLEEFRRLNCNSEGVKSMNIDENSIIRQNPKTTIVAISDTEVGKIISSNSKRELTWEADKLQYANGINDLLVKYKRLDKINSYHVLVMERLYPLQSRAYELKRRMEFGSQFKVMLVELHEKGFAYGDLGYATKFDVEYNDSRTVMATENVIITTRGIRLIDAERSVLLNDVGKEAFNNAIAMDLSGLYQVERALMGNTQVIITGG